MATIQRLGDKYTLMIPGDSSKKSIVEPDVRWAISCYGCVLMPNERMGVAEWSERIKRVYAPSPQTLAALSVIESMISPSPA
jgi:hypothetical protein